MPKAIILFNNVAWVQFRFLFVVSFSTRQVSFVCRDNWWSMFKQKNLNSRSLLWCAFLPPHLISTIIANALILRDKHGACSFFKGLWELACMCPCICFLETFPRNSDFRPPCVHVKCKFPIHFLQSLCSSCKISLAVLCVIILSHDCSGMWWHC